MTKAESPPDSVVVGLVYEKGLSDRQRELGSHFTPFDVADMLVGRALEIWDQARVSSDGAESADGPRDAPARAPRCCDPACGGGVFLLAAAHHLAARGVTPERIVNELLLGADNDPGAVAASSDALRCWAVEQGARSAVSPRIELCDALDVRLIDEGRFDLVIGNPPFQSQLASRTSRSVADRDRMRARFDLDSLGYLDTAALFQLRGLELVGLGGVVMLIQPRSFLVARDCRPVRAAVLQRGELRRVWIPGEPVFLASVDVCATFVRRGAAENGTSAAVDVTGGRDGATSHGSVPAADLEGSTWSPLWAQAKAVPFVRAPSAATDRRRLGDVATATAGFRDQYYGFIDHLVDTSRLGAVPLVTTAMIDPGTCAWSSRRVRISGAHRVSPLLDRWALANAFPALGRWVDAQMTPKVLVATQTNVIEAVLDRSGDWVPMTPVISVAPLDPDDVSAAHLEAALLAPAATAWAMRSFGGGALSAGGLKLAARQVLEIPLPGRLDLWGDGVAILASRRHSTDLTDALWHEFGSVMNAAWSIDDTSLIDWWWGRFPRNRCHAATESPL